MGTQPRIRTSRKELQRAALPSARSALPHATLQPVADLQRRLGNQGVLRLLQSRRLQAKLAISEPGDVGEREENAVADQVLRTEARQVDGGVDRAGILRRKRAADIVHLGYYTFYLKAGDGKEFAIQFYYPGTGQDVNVKIAHTKTGAMAAGTFTLAAGKSFSASAVKDGDIGDFDLDGDGAVDLSVLVRIDQHRSEYLTKPTAGGLPTIRGYDLRDAYLAATWKGGQILLESPDSRPPEAVAPPLWVMRPHPHPNIGMVYFNTRTHEYIIPPPFPYSLSSNAKGPPAVFKQTFTMSGVSYTPQAKGREAVTDPLSKAGAASSGLTEGHEALKGLAAIPHANVPNWGAVDVARWKAPGGGRSTYSRIRTNGCGDTVRSSASPQTPMTSPKCCWPAWPITKWAA